MTRTKQTPKKRVTRQREKRDRPVEENRSSTADSVKKRKLNTVTDRETNPVIVTPELNLPSTSGNPLPEIFEANHPVPSPISSQGSSENGSISAQHPMHKTQNFQKYLKDVRSKSIPGSWHDFDYEETAKNTRYSAVSNWLRSEKPKLQHLVYNGKRTGFYKCVKCADRGCLHIIKACTTDVTKFKMQNIKKHFDSKAHQESNVMNKLHEFSNEWKKAMDIKYLKMMAKHHVSGGIFKSEEFTEIIMSWVNEVSNTKIDAETIRKEIPDRRTLQRRLDDLSIQVKGNF